MIIIMIILTTTIIIILIIIAIIIRHILISLKKRSENSEKLFPHPTRGFIFKMRQGE